MVIMLDDGDTDDTDDTNVTRRVFDLLQKDNFKLRDSDLVQIEFQDDWLLVYLFSFRGLALLLLIRYCCS